MKHLLITAIAASLTACGSLPEGVHSHNGYSAPIAQPVTIQVAPAVNVPPAAGTPTVPIAKDNTPVVTPKPPVVTPPVVTPQPKPEKEHKDNSDKDSHDHHHQSGGAAKRHNSSH